MAPPLVAVAHGSRDPRSAATIRALLDLVCDLDVRVAFLDLSTPRLPDVLSALAAEGHREAVLVPLLLGAAYHARVDLPSAMAEAHARHPRLRLSLSPVLGPDDRLETLALRRLTEAGAHLDDRALGIVLAGAGSSHPPANAAVAAVAAKWARTLPVAGVRAAFASTATPDVPTAIASLRAAGAHRIAVASWFLAPGRLPDRVTTLAGEDTVVAAPLGAAPELASLITHRYTETAATPTAAHHT